MGDPQLAYPVIHVTGTNGKGSTSQMITRLLMAHGLTRRHVHQPAPRAAQRAHQPQRRADQRRRLRRADRRGRRSRGARRRAPALLRDRRPRPRSAGSPTWPSMSPSSRSACSAGGTPPTSSTPQVAVITNIGMDHTEFAGPTQADIAAREGGHHQAGQRGGDRRDRPGAASTSSPRPGGASVLRARRRLRRAREPAGPRRSAASTCARRPRSTPTCSCRCTAATRATTRSSRSTAVEAFFAAPLADDVVREGFADVRMPGRFEVLGHQPLVIVDGAHNPPGADSCAQVFFEDFDPAGRRILVVGMPARPRPEGDAVGAARRRVRHGDHLHRARRHAACRRPTSPPPRVRSAATR